MMKRRSLLAEVQRANLQARRVGRLVDAPVDQETAADAYVAPEPTPQPRAAATKSDPGPEYVTELMELQRRAVAHFGIGPKRWPKQDELERFFLAQSLPHGIPISRHLAKMLATVCRPVAAMRGGNKRG